MNSELDFENLKSVADELYQNGDYEKAFGFYEKCSQLQPQNALIYNRLGHLIKKINPYQDLEKQVMYYQKALEVDPAFDPALRNLAFAYSRMCKYDDALECFDKLLNLNPIADDYFFYACLKIRLKDFEQGWKYYEYRFNKEFGPTLLPKIDKPRWDGQEIKDKTLLVHYEQGFGDSLQFCRYFEQVKPLVKKIIFVVQDELSELMSANLKGVHVVGGSTPLAELDFDYYVPLMSLPLALMAKYENIPFAEGYIRADEIKIEKYKKEFFDNDCIKIGISYHGAPFGNKRRNVNLKYFYPLLDIKNVQIYSFQKGQGTNQLKRLPNGFEIVDLGTTFNDFSDTAAAMENLDLFVTSDNALLNLAGSMGVKTCLLLGKDAEWRWFLDAEMTPWYDSVKIFKKQDELEDWSIQMKKVINVIKNEFWGK